MFYLILLIITILYFILWCCIKISSKCEEDYEKYLLEFYEYTYFPESALNAGKAVYIKRNREMIDKSRFCVFYYSKTSEPTKRNSGTKIAYDYAVHKKRKIYSMPLCR